MKRNFLLLILGALVGLLLSSCGTYVPPIRDVREDRLEGDYWRQRFTLYNPANPTSDCQIDRTGQRLDLNSRAEIAHVWRKFCRSTTDNNSRSDNN